MHAAPVTRLRPIADSLQGFVGKPTSLTRVPAVPAVSFHMLSLVQDLTNLMSMWSAGNCGSANRVRTFRHLTCCSQSVMMKSTPGWLFFCSRYSASRHLFGVAGQNTQPGISRKALKGALEEAARTEGGYLTKLLIVSAIGKQCVVWYFCRSGACC